MPEIEIKETPAGQAAQGAFARTTEKRTLRIFELLSEIDAQKRIYPKGLVSSLRGSSDFDFLLAKRIELFARKEEKSYGILREFFVAFSSASNLLDLAGASSNVIAIHGFSREGEWDRKKMLEDRLVLKRAPGCAEKGGARFSIFRENTPDLLVPEYWLHHMHLNSGDRVIISNPRENYAVPPPLLKRN